MKQSIHALGEQPELEGLQDWQGFCLTRHLQRLIRMQPGVAKALLVAAGHDEMELTPGHWSGLETGELAHSNLSGKPALKEGVQVFVKAALWPDHVTGVLYLKNPFPPDSRKRDLMERALQRE